MSDQKIKILIIDDDDVDRMAIKRVIKYSGIEADIFHATDMQTGTVLAFEKEFDCIFLDYDLPGNDGFEFLENYRNKKGQSPVIFVTSHADKKLADEAIKKGASVFIPKNQLTVECITQLLSDTNNIKLSGNIEASTGEQVPEALQIVETIVANTPVIIFSIDQNGIFKFLKGKVSEPFQLTEEEITGKSIFDTGLNLPIRTGDYENALLKNNFISSIEMNDRFFQVHYVQIKNDENNTVGINGVVLDITALKKQEQELKNALAASEETQKIKESFLANMSHEVRTPIHGIINLTDILLKTVITDEQLKCLEGIKNSAGILRVIINDILDLSKIEAQKMRFENAQFHLRDIVHGNIEMFRSRAEEKKLKLSLNYDENLSEFLNGDSVRLSQVINNLLNNAIKFTHEGEIKMEVFTEEKNENFCLVTFKISDTGIGIPQHKLSSIFDSFEQAGDDITRKYGGTGLGLNICKKLVELQGGMISVESVHGKGSTFMFKLPFENIVAENINSKGITNNPPEISYNKELNILVVEDNDINRMVINIMMRDWNFKTDNVTNGSDAIDKIEQNNYDVVLMDIEMPGMNGYQTSEHIRKKLSAPENAIPILAMTAHANSSEKEKCLNA
ncbi:MAG: response regulator, partial [Bacteroidota bacterium]